MNGSPALVLTNGLLQLHSVTSNSAGLFTGCLLLASDPALLLGEKFESLLDNDAIVMIVFRFNAAQFWTLR